jgi:hypothetical protein
MQLAVSFDKEGQITLMFNPAKLRGKKFVIGYSPAPNENHHILDVPQHLEGKNVRELAQLLRVNTLGATPKLEAKA